MKKTRQPVNTTMLMMLAVMFCSVLAGVIYARVYMKPVIPGTPAAQRAEQYSMYTDSSKLYTVRYPSAWTLREEPECCEGPSKDYTESSRPIELIPADISWTHNRQGVALQADKSLELATAITKNWQDNNHKPELIQLGNNKVQVQYVKIDFKGDAEQYVEHQYLLNATEGTVFISFREKHNHPMSETEYDNGRYLPELRTIVESVAFL